MKKQIMAILAVLLMTSCLGISIFAIGGAALINKNGAVVADAPSQISMVSNSDLPQQDQAAQLQNLVSQYQDREQQYQQREQQLKDELAQANEQIMRDQQPLQQVQLLLAALQQRGMIRITNDGQIIINQ